MKLAIITVNTAGEKLAEKLKRDFPRASIFGARAGRKDSLKNLVKDIFARYEGLIFIGALGITIRLIARCVKSKLSDPAVVTVDTAGRFAISVLSGHEGGANSLAFLVAASLGAAPVITTGTETHKRFILGIGTRRGISADAVKKAIKKAVDKKGIGCDAIRLVSTIELKKDEKGLVKACRELELPLLFIPKESIINFKGGLSVSEAARRNIGVDGVCEPCALLAGRRTKLILKKEILCGVTVAIAEEN